MYKLYHKTTKNQVDTILTLYGLSDKIQLGGDFMNIIGKSECTASQMAQYLINKNPNAKPWALEYAKLYLEEGEFRVCSEDGGVLFA